MKNLISHSDYEDSIDLLSVSDAEFRTKSRNHKSFLKQPLELWMFVPCDEDGNVLKKPEAMNYEPVDIYNNTFQNDLKEHQQAKERCLFEGFDGSIQQLKNLIKLKITVENMVKYNLTLTNQAIQQLER